MRFYRLVLTNAAGQVYQPDSKGGFQLVAPGANVSTFTSHVQTNTGGLQYNPGAANIEFEFAVAPAGTAQGGPIIRVHGVGLQMIGRAAKLSGANFQLYGGMQLGIAGAKGLANPSQVGLIAQGTVFNGFGNWQGVLQSIDLVILPGFVVPPQGITFSWTPGTTLDAALLSTLTAAFPQAQVTINITPNLAAPNNAWTGAYYPTFAAFADNLQQITTPLGVSLGLANYDGVKVSWLGNRILVTDSTTPGKTVQLNFQDLIGQPTWINTSQVSFKCVLRADINLGDQIVFPAGVVAPYALTSPGAAFPGAPARSKSIFQNAFIVQDVHYYANFRQPDAEAWNTTFVATPLMTGT